MKLAKTFVLPGAEPVVSGCDLNQTGTLNETHPTPLSNDGSFAVNPNATGFFMPDAVPVQPSAYAAAPHGSETVCAQPAVAPAAAAVSNAAPVGTPASFGGAHAAVTAAIGAAAVGFMSDGFGEVESFASRELQIQPSTMELARFLSQSSFMPAALRAPNVDRKEQAAADAYVIISRAAQVGLSPVAAFDKLFTITDKSGQSRLGMYVNTKAGLCRRFGSWTVTLDAANAVAVASGRRNDNGDYMEVVFSGYDAQLRGLMRFDVSTQTWEGVSRWADKWPDMLRTRALGRLLDALFPDIIGGFISQDEQDDLLSSADAEVSKSTERVKRALSKRRTRQATQDPVEQPNEVSTAAQSDNAVEQTEPSAAEQHVAMDLAV